MVRELIIKKVILYVSLFFIIIVPFNLIGMSQLPTHESNFIYSIFEVGPNQNYKTITEALEDSSDGDMILVYPGFYQENIIVSKSVIIKGLFKNKTIIDGSGKECTLKIIHNQVSLINLTIQNSGKNETKGKSSLTAYESGVWIDCADLNIINCNFNNNTKTSIFVDNLGSSLYINGCSFQGPSMNHIRFGTSDINSVTIRNSHFNNNYYHIVFYGPRTVKKLLIANNYFISIDNAGSHIKSISFIMRNSYQSVQNSLIRNNTFFMSNVGINLSKGSEVEIAYNSFVNCTSFGIEIYDSKVVLIHHNNFINCNQGEIQCKNSGKTIDWNNTNGFGNYWSDYNSWNPNAINVDGRWSSPYQILGNASASDEMPLTEMSVFFKNYNSSFYLGNGYDIDNDLLTDYWEYYYFNNLDNGTYNDPDNDSLSNFDEFLLNSNPVDFYDPLFIYDSDYDGINDTWELRWFKTLDYDSYHDYDEDGFTEYNEYLLDSDPTNYLDPGPIIDDDILPDEWEVEYFGNCLQSPYDDYDHDNYTNLEEYEWDTDPTDPLDNPFSAMIDRSPKAKNELRIDLSFGVYIAR